MLRPFTETPSDYSRRLALLELDVLVAMETGVSLPDLISAATSCFPVLMQYEDEQAYDSTGKIAFTTDKSLATVGLPRSAKGDSLCWDVIMKSNSGVFRRVIDDDTVPEGPVELAEEFVAPFFKCNRVEDYSKAWNFFAKVGLDA